MNLIQMAKEYDEHMAGKIVGAKVNNTLVSLDFAIKEKDNVELIDTTSLEGIRIYRNTLKFILIKACYDLYPNEKLSINYGINRGSFCKLNKTNVSREDINKIKKRMKSIISKEAKIDLEILDIKTAKKVLASYNRDEKISLLGNSDEEFTKLYNLLGVYGYFYGILAPNASFANIFDIKEYKDGFLLLYPTRFKPYKISSFEDQELISNEFLESKQWGEILGIKNVSDISDIIHKDKIKDIILVSEALQEKKIAYIADNIKNKKKRFAFIAGPSSSGKTTFANRLLIQLRANGLKGNVISLDNYYKGIGKTPLDLFGKPDYETIDALDLELLNKNIKELNENGVSRIPIYDFHTETIVDYKDTYMGENDIIIFEGIHGLNPKICTCVDEKLIHKIYISALTSINIDSHNRFASTDTRLIRRIVRDYTYRGASAEKTIKMWTSVRYGEDKYIFPYQEKADDIFNSSLIYEHGVLKEKAEEVLRKVNDNSEALTESKRLLEIIECFDKIEATYIPQTSLLREFIGGSAFRS